MRALLCADGVNSGLDFEKALKSADDPQLVKFQGSPQVMHIPPCTPHSRLQPLASSAHARLFCCTTIWQSLLHGQAEAVCQGPTAHFAWTKPGRMPCVEQTSMVGCMSAVQAFLLLPARPQIVIQLRKFAEAVKRIKGAIAPAPTAPPQAGGPGALGGAGLPGDGSRGLLGRDMSNTLRTDMTGIDPSLGGAQVCAVERCHAAVLDSCTGRRVLLQLAH